MFQFESKDFKKQLAYPLENRKLDRISAQKLHDKKFSGILVSWIWTFNSKIVTKLKGLSQIVDKSLNNSKFQMFKLLKTKLYLILFIFISLSVGAGERIERLESTINNIQPFSSQFRQFYYDAFQEKTMQSNGEFYFRQPGLMKWHYQSPEETLFIVGSEKAWLYDPILENVTVQELDKVSGIKTMRFLSRNEKISTHFKEISPKASHLDKLDGTEQIFLSPLDKNQALAQLQIAFDQKKNQIKQFVIIDHNSNYRKITLSDIKTDSSIGVEMFDFKITDEMEVIEGFAK